MKTPLYVKRQYEKVKSHKNSPHAAQWKKTDSKSRSYGVLADHYISMPIMRRGVVHFS